MERSLRNACRTLGAALLLALPAAIHAQGGARVENPTFSAAVTSFQTSAGANAIHFVTATVRFQNRTQRPLTLVCDPTKTTASDDQGNRYAGAVIRGIGLVRGTSVDPKFVLPAGGGGDMLVEMRSRIAPTAARGVTFDLDLTTREVSSLPSGQYQLGTERALGFTGLKNGFALPLPTERIVDAGPFTAELLRSKVGAAGRWKTVDVTLRLKNTSDRPLTLAYESTTSYGVDDQGNRFGYGVAGTHDTSFSGIGLAAGAKVDPQFVLAPGESKEIRFTVMRPNGREVAGSRMVYYVALQSLEALPSDQIRTVRQYSLAFPGVPLAR